MQRQVLTLGLLALLALVSSDQAAGASPAVLDTGYPAASYNAGAMAKDLVEAPRAVGMAKDLVEAPSAVAIATGPDYPSAGWAPAAPSNYSVFDRPADFQVNMIVIHDIEGSYYSAISTFQDPNRHGSSHYVISRTGRIAQVVLEKDVAWHAGNWDYNTRAIGIEHEGYAGTPGSFTNAEYRASAAVAASICSRWGVPMDRAHVIGHNQVPDPNNPALGGGADHHWDPGPYWNWSYYIFKAAQYARTLPSPPHMGPNPTAVSMEGGITLSWKPAQSCTAPITGYSVVGQPGNISMSLPATTTSVWIPGLTDGVAYSFTVMATNAQGQSSLSSNTAIPGAGCTAATITSNPTSPQTTGTSILLTATSTACNSPEYAFWLKPRGGYWTLLRDYGRAPSWTWNTGRVAAGTYQLEVWARQKGSGKDFDAYGLIGYTLGATGCPTAALAPSLAPPQMPGAQVTFIASSTVCSAPQFPFRKLPRAGIEFQFWLLTPAGIRTIEQPYGGSSWTWNTTGRTPGTYIVSVWARQAGSTANYDAGAVMVYQLAVATCSSATIGTSPGSPQAAGTLITFNATSAGCISPKYEFWERPPGGTWKLVRSSGTGTTFVWNSAGAPAGDYSFAVRAVATGSINTYDTYALRNFSIS